MSIFTELLTKIASLSLHGLSIVVYSTSGHVVLVVTLCNFTIRVDLDSKAEVTVRKVGDIYPLAVRVPVVHVVAVWGDPLWGTAGTVPFLGDTSIALCVFQAETGFVTFRNLVVSVV